MDEIIRLIVPPHRFSAIDYFLEEVDGLSKEITGIKLTVPAYNRMTEDPYLKCFNVLTIEGKTFAYWVGEEITIEGKYYPPLRFTLLMLDDGSALVRNIDCGDKTFVFESDTYNLEIDYRAA